MGEGFPRCPSALYRDAAARWLREGLRRICAQKGLELADEQGAGFFGVACAPEGKTDYALAVIAPARPDAPQPVEAADSFCGKRLFRRAIIPSAVEHVHGVACPGPRSRVS